MHIVVSEYSSSIIQTSAVSDAKGKSPNMTVALTTCTTRLPSSDQSTWRFKHLTLPLGSEV